MLELKDISIHTIDSNGTTLSIGSGDNGKRFSLHAEEGQLTALLCPNAAMTTAILRAMMALWAVDEGYVAIDGELLNASTRRIFKDKMCYIPYDVDVDSGTFHSIVSTIYGLEHVGEGKSEMRRTFNEMEHLHIDRSVVNNNMREMSLSERRLLLIAAALGTNRPIVIADHPTLGLDDDSRRCVIGRFKQLATDGRTIIVATEDSTLAAAANKVVNIKI